MISFKNDHLPPSSTPIPQLDGEALEPEPEPVLQQRQRYKMWDRAWGQRDIDHPTLCVICDVQVYRDRDRSNLIGCKCDFDKYDYFHDD